MPLKPKSYKLKADTRGFSLIETLMALFVLMVGVIGSFAVVSQAIRTSPTARQELIAAQLAQEGIEISRNVRDNTLLQIGDDRLQGSALSKDWTSGLKHCGNADSYQTHMELADKDDISSGWSFDSGCGASAIRYKIYREPNTGFMSSLRFQGPSSADGWEDTGFRRGFDITKYTCSNPPTCSILVLDNACTTNCHEIRILSKVYWNTDTMPTICPGPGCVLAEDRLTNWIDYLDSIL